MKLRKMIITALATTMLFSLAACGDAANTDDSTETVTTTEAAEATESTEAETTASEDSEGENSSTDDSETDSAEASDDSETDSAEDGTPQGDGLVSEEELQKGWAWMKSYGFKIFKNMTYEEVAEHFGVDGELFKDEYAENIKRNKRDYKWISKDDATHYIMVNFEETDAEGAPGVYTVSAFTANGFDGAEAEQKYKDDFN